MPATKTALILALLLLALACPQLAQDSQPPVELPDGWRWDRPAPGNASLRGDAIELVTERGRIWAGDGNRNRIMTREPVGEVADVSANIELVDAANKFEQCGLLLYQHDESFVKLVVEHIDGLHFVVMAKEAEGSRKVLAKIEIEGSRADLRLQVDGTAVHGTWRVQPSADWSDAAATELPYDGSRYFGVFTQDAARKDPRKALVRNLQWKNTEPAGSIELVRPPASLELVGVLHDDRALNRAHDVELQGNLAFVPGKGGSLAIIDISDPATPKLVSSLADPVEYEDAETVLPMGDVLLLGTRDFLAIDISHPANPKVLKKISDRPRIDRINGMARFGDHVLAACKSGYIAVFDVSDPRNPMHVDSLHSQATGGPQMPHDIAVFGNHAIVADTEQQQPHSVHIYQIAHAGSGELLPAREWKLAGQVANTFNWGDLQGANRVVTWGNRYAAVGAFQPDRVGIIDISDPAQPKQIANLPVCDIDATGLAIYGSMLLASGGECAEVIDVSDPANPKPVAQYRGGRLFPTRRLVNHPGGVPRYDNGHDLVYRDGYIYVTAQNDNRLGILRVTDPQIRNLAEANNQ